VLARRILLYTAVLLLALTIASAFNPRDDEDDDAPPTATVPRAGSPSAPERVEVAFPASDPVRVRVGDIVEISVKAPEADRVAIEDLGVRGPVGPGIDSPLVVVADRAGTFPVTLRFTERRIGTLTVRAR
jgi:hypothetical protein